MGAGALCHGVLPRCPRRVGDEEGFRYVDFAIRNLAKQFDRFGARRDELEIKVFGGADVLPVPATTSGKRTVGQQNWHTALEILQQERLTVIASDVGGLVGRTIEFDTGNGEVLLRRLLQMDGQPW